MKNLVTIAALLMATTAAHAGSGVTFQINGERIHIEAPRHCDAPSCIKITAPGFSGSLWQVAQPESCQSGYSSPTISGLSWFLEVRYSAQS